MNIYNQDLTEKAFEEIEEQIGNMISFLSTCEDYNVSLNDSFWVTYLETTKEVCIFKYPLKDNEESLEFMFQYPLFKFLLADSFCISGDNIFKYGTKEERLKNCQELREKINTYEVMLLNNE